MEQVGQGKNASVTAFGTLYLRAVHQLLDAKPLILEDPVSLMLLGEEQAAEITRNRRHHRTPEARALRAHIVLRTRFTEDRLAEAVARGVTQYVILGAGFETFAFRQPEWARQIRIYEVDHPATQNQKRRRVQEAGLAIPDNLFFVEINFEYESLQKGLLRQGLSFDEPTFFSWLGVTVYLKEAAIDEVLQGISAFPPRSEIILTFAQPLHVLSRREFRIYSSLSALVREVGEPMISFFTPAEMEKKLKSAGFGTVAFVSRDEAERLCFDGRPRDLLVTDRSVIACAIR